TMGELAALLAHQIAHVTANHGRFASAGRSASIPLYFMGSAGRICMRGADATLLMPVAFKGRFVANEGDADLIARHYLERAGYDPIEVQPVFEKLLRPVPTPRKTPTLAR
ncbi:MAG: M48 family metalloprotease, partial [Bryobacteraceae bacterium]